MLLTIYFIRNPISSRTKNVALKVGQGAHGETKLIEKDALLVPVTGASMHKAFHATGVSSHIVPGHVLSNIFEVSSLLPSKNT